MNNLPVPTANGLTSPDKATVSARVHSLPNVNHTAQEGAATGLGTMNKTWQSYRTAPDSYELASQEDRCAPRTRVNIPATLRPSGAKGFHTQVHDLSLGGFSAVAVNRMHVGTVCWLTLPGLESLQAEVVWWQGAQVGCAFANLLSPIVHDNILARYRGDGVFRPVS